MGANGTSSFYFMVFEWGYPKEEPSELLFLVSFKKPKPCNQSPSSLAEGQVVQAEILQSLSMRYHLSRAWTLPLVWPMFWDASGVFPCVSSWWAGWKSLLTWTRTCTLVVSRTFLCVYSSCEVLGRKNPPRLCKASCTGGEMPSAVVRSSGTAQAVPDVAPWCTCSALHCCSRILVFLYRCVSKWIKLQTTFECLSIKPQKH